MKGCYYLLDNYEYLKTQVYKLTKINLDAYKERQMKRRIDAFINKQNTQIDLLTGSIKELSAKEKEEKFSYVSFVRKIKNDQKMMDSFIEYLTINVSEFFRNPEQWKQLEESILPHLFETFGRDLRIWSAACSTGDEPYSLVMALSKFLPLSKIHIYATDLDEGVIERAKLGIYNINNLKEVPKEFMDKYFVKINEKTYQISEKIKSCVSFRKHNLLNDEYLQRCNLIVCRNVLIYFTEEAKDEIYKKFNSSLLENGILFIGSTEQIFQASSYNFYTYKSFFYEKITKKS